MHPTKEVIASWPKANFVNPETRGPALTVVNVVFIVLVVLVVTLRYYTRLRISKSFGLDDWVIGASLVRRAFSLYGTFLTFCVQGSYIRSHGSVLVENLRISSVI